jgi:hypothetical protein
MCGICKDFNCASIICHRGFDREVGVFTTPKFADIIDSLEQLVVADKKAFSKELVICKWNRICILLTRMLATLKTITRLQIEDKKCMLF